MWNNLLNTFFPFLIYHLYLHLFHSDMSLKRMETWLLSSSNHNLMMLCLNRYNHLYLLNHSFIQLYCRYKLKMYYSHSFETSCLGMYHMNYRAIKDNLNRCRISPWIIVCSSQHIHSLNMIYLMYCIDLYFSVIKPFLFVNMMRIQNLN